MIFSIKVWENEKEKKFKSFQNTLFNENFDIQKMNGYQNRYTLTDVGELNPKCSILVNTYKAGRYRKTNDTTIYNTII